MAILSDHTDSTLPSRLLSSCTTITKLASQSSLSSSEWTDVTTAAQLIANSSNTHQLRSDVGSRTGTIDSISRLLRNLLSMEDSQGVVKARMECCRVVGNLCFDHDENRQLVLDAGIPELIMETIHTTTRWRGEEPEKGEERVRRLLRVEELKLLRAAVGATMNSSLKFDPMRKHLASTPSTFRALLSLVDNRPTSRSTQPVYVVGQWVRDRGDMSEEEWEERLELGEMIAGWTMNVLEDILSEDNSNFPSPAGIPILASIVLSLPFSSSSSPSASSSPPSLSSLSLAFPSPDSDSDDSSSLDTSIELLSIASSLLEGLVVDHSSHKLTLASPSTHYNSVPSPQSTLLYNLLDFLEFSRPPSNWVNSEDERKRLDKTIGLVKTAIGRAVVECPNEDRVMHEIWRDGEWVVERMKSWLVGKEEREDLIICASHFLAGLGRTDEYTERLVHQYGLVEPLVSIVRERIPVALSPPAEGSTGGENTQILYGVISLLRHLAIPLKNRQIVSDTRIVGLLTELLRDKMDIVKLLQMSVVGLLKHLTNLNIPNSLDLLSSNSSTSPKQEARTTPLDLILALIKRTDELQLRSESTRILINLIRSLFSASSTSPNEDVERAKEAVLEKKEIIEAVSEQVRRSGKYPVLVNEGIVALSLLSGHGEKGASIVLASLVNTPSPPLPPVSTDPSSPESSLTPSQPSRRSSQSTETPSTSLDQLLDYLSSAPTITQSGTSGIRPEMIVNVCTLLITTLKNAPSSESRTDEVKRRVRETLNEVGEREGSQGKEWDAIRILRRVVDDWEEA